MSDDTAVEDLWSQLYEIGKFFSNKPQLANLLLQGVPRYENHLEIIKHPINRKYSFDENIDNSEALVKTDRGNAASPAASKKRPLSSISMANVEDKENLDSKNHMHTHRFHSKTKGRPCKPYRDSSAAGKKKKLKELLEHAAYISDGTTDQSIDIHDSIDVLGECSEEFSHHKPSNQIDGVGNLESFCHAFVSELAKNQVPNSAEIAVTAASTLAKVFEIDPIVPVIAPLIGISESYAYRLLKKGISRVSAPSNLVPYENPPKRGRPNIKPFHEEICNTRLQRHLLEYFQDTAPVKSGSRNFRRLRETTFKEAWQNYRQSMQSRQLPSLEYSQFRKISHSFGIHSAIFDEYACPYCQTEDTAADHQKQLEEQFRAYDQQKQTLKQGNSAILIQDYCRIHEVKSTNDAPEKANKKSKLSVCGFVLLWWDKDSSSYKSFNADFFSRNRQSSSFLSKALTLFMSYCGDKLKSQWKRIDVWADGNTRTHMNLFNFYVLHQELRRINSNHITLVCNFFPPYHGHNRCDAHFGAGKVAIRKNCKQSISTSDKTAIEQFSNLPCTRTFYIDEILAQQIHLDLMYEESTSKHSQVPVKSFFSFKFEVVGVETKKHQISIFRYTTDLQSSKTDCYFTPKPIIGHITAKIDQGGTHQGSLSARDAHFRAAWDKIAHEKVPGFCN